MGGGQKFSLRRLQAVGRHIYVTSSPGRMVTYPAAELLGRWLESWSGDAGGGAAAILAAPGFEPPTKKSAVACIAIWPLPMLRPAVLPTAWTRVCH